MPPRKKKWTKGHQQIGLFIRTEDGSTIEVTWDKAPKEISRLAALMVADRLGVRELAEKALIKVDQVAPGQ